MKLKLITTTPGGNYELYISRDDSGNPVLAYKIGSDVHTVKCGGLPLVKCSTLERILSDNFICDTKFIISTYNTSLYYLTPDPSLFNPANKFIPTIDTISLDRGEVSGFSSSGITGSTKSIKVCDNWYDNIREQEEADKAITERASSIFGDQTNYSKASSNNLGEYSVDTYDSSFVIELVSGTTYTDTVYVKDLIMKVGKSGVSAKMDISYMYSIGGSIFSGMQSIQAFRYNESLIIQDVIMTLGDVQMEYIGGTLRIYPVSVGVDEVVINDCIMTVGNLDG